MRQVKDALGTIRSLLGDPDGEWITDAYVIPLLDLYYADTVLNLKNASGRELQAVIPIPDVPAGTTSLYTYQLGTALAGQEPPGAGVLPLLAGLFDPIEIWVKPAGSPRASYRKALERDTLPHLDSNALGPTPFGAELYWNFLGNRLSITPLNRPLDIEVTGKFNAAPLQDLDDILAAHEDIWIPVCWGTAATAGVERSNPQILTGYATKATAAADNVIAAIIRRNQGTPERFQRISREGGIAQWWWSI